MTFSMYKGVAWNPPSKKWVVFIRRDGHSTYLGSFTKEEDAAWAYDVAAKKYHGEYASLNFPREVTE
jgi:hypothetical protein